jgi:hypothetical protein
MRRVRIAGLIVVVGVLIGGCGSSGSGSTAAQTVPGKGRAVEAPIESRGTKGENPTTEAAGTAHISTADCEALAKLAERQTGVSLRLHSTPKPPLSRCRLDGPGTSLNIYLDAGFAANQRYHNRIEETVQFNSQSQNQRGLPQPVPRVGEKAAYNSAASWIPALRSLLAVRGNRWLTVTLSVVRRSDPELLAQAAVLARAGFKLTADG